jgi:adenine-specific DNA-methyltransferase
MAKVEDLIKNIPDAQLRDEIAREVSKLKSQKKFGLVFEEHLPEQVLLPGLPIKPGTRVVKRGAENEIFTVIEPENGSRKNLRFRVIRESDGQEQIALGKELIVIKKFGEPIYPTLLPIDRVTRAPGKPYHTIINAENFHALQLLLYCYEGQVDVIYIDPPYNTGARDWKYNNDYVDRTDQFRHSKWLSMMKKRLSLARRLLKPDGVLIITIDDTELSHLGVLLEEQFSDRLLHLITIVINPGGTYQINFARTHEYAWYIVPRSIEVVTGRPLTADEINLFKEDEDDGKPYELWKLRRTGAESAHRHQRPNQFYPIYVNADTMKVIKVGDEVGKNEKYSRQIQGSLLPVFPIDGNGVERVWRYARETMADKIRDELVIAKRVKGVVNLYLKVYGKDSKRLKTVWYEGSHSSVGTASTVMVDSILDRVNSFPFPKSLYAVKDSLAAVCRKRPNALILDFFAGSGTTLHATSLINSEDDGQRRCILVTNNEVPEKTAKLLNAEGYYPGSERFEEQGICESVTWPRCKYVINGKRDDGTKLPGTYSNGTPLKNGFAENVEYFKLDFLDPNDIAYGEKLEAILPLLWLIAGATGELDMGRGSTASGRWLLPKNSRYALLVQEEHFAEFKRELKERPDITHVFLVTDSEEAYHEMIAELPGSPKTKMLYKSYLENFRINTERNL